MLEDIQKKAQAGDSRSQYVMGQLAYKRNKYDYARTWFQLAGENEITPQAAGLFNLAVLEEKGLGGNKDEWSAFCHYEAAGSLGHVDAHINAARLLQKSETVRQQFQALLSQQNSTIEIKSLIEQRQVHHYTVASLLNDTDAKKILAHRGFPVVPETSIDAIVSRQIQLDSLENLQAHLEDTEQRRKEAEAAAKQLSQALEAASAEKKKLNESLYEHIEKIRSLETKEKRAEQLDKQATLYEEEKLLLEQQQEELGREREVLRSKEAELQQRWKSIKVKHDNQLVKEKEALKLLKIELQISEQELTQQQQELVKKRDKLKKKQQAFRTEMAQSKEALTQEERQLFTRIEIEQQRLKQRAVKLNAEKQKLKNQKKEFTQTKQIQKESEMKLKGELADLRKVRENLIAEKQRLSEKMLLGNKALQQQLQGINQKEAELTQKEKIMLDKEKQLQQQALTQQQKETELNQQWQSLQEKEAQLKVQEKQLQEMGCLQDRASIAQQEAERWQKFAQRYSQEAENAVRRAEYFKKEAEQKTQAAKEAQELLDKLLSVKKPTHLSTAIHWSNLTIGEKLGEGAFATVYKGIYHRTHVAIKMIKQQNLNQMVIGKLHDEITVMKTVESPRVVRCFGACFETNHYALVMEYIEGSTLHALLYASGNIISCEQRYQLSIEISVGMAYLHSKNIVHGDLKAANVLVDKEGHAKIADFGESKVVLSCKDGYETILGQRVGGTPNYLAPELLEQLEHYADGYRFKSPEVKTTKETDTYSYGIILFELFTGKNPYLNDFTQKTYNDAREIVCQQKNRKAIENDLERRSINHLELKNVIKLCLFAEKPVERPKIANALEVIEKAYQLLDLRF